MKNIISDTFFAKISLIIIMIFGVDGLVFSQNQSDATLWRLAWSDEFTDSINWNEWSKVPRGTPDWKRHMSDWDSLYAVKDGNLILRAVNNLSQGADTAQFLTGGIWGFQKKFFGLGRMEVRAKLGCARGFWPAIWMLPNLNGRVWPDDGEIDIMEHLNYDSIVYQTVHSYYTTTLGLGDNPPKGCVIAYNPNEYNIFAVERYQDSLVFFVNDQRSFCYPKIETDKKGQFPFNDNPFYLILSAQLGGSWVGKVSSEELPTEMLIDYVRYYEPVTLPVIPSPKEFAQHGTDYHKIISIDVSKSDNANSDEYYLLINKGVVTIKGNEVWARQTIKQLQNKNDEVPNVEIHDWAAYPFRGFMHDTGRNYQSIGMLKQTLDLMSMYKLNYFHWHLTDHPAWRIECKAYPQLNDPQYQRPGRDEGKFYTYDEIREIITYAKERGITVVPEIDMPGHSTYFNATFGFPMDSKKGKKVLKKCLEEFFEEIPVEMCPYFHVGSDEIHIADPEGFMRFTEKIVKKHGRKALAWDPGLPSSETTIRQIWNEAAGSNAASASKPGKYVDSFVGYLNYYDPMVYTNRVLLHTAAAQNQPDTSVAMGGILCLWNDVRVDDKRNIALHNGMINGMMAFSERFWVGGDFGAVKNPNVLPDKGSVAGKRLADFSKKMAYHRDNKLRYFNIRWVANSEIQWKVKIGEGEWLDVWGGAVDMDELCRVEDIKVGEKIEAVAKTKIIAENDTIIRAWVGFEAPARSNRISGGIGEQGKWENEGRLLVNGEEVFPSKPWNEPGKYSYHFHTWGKPQEEEPYTDEQLYWMREPAYIPLKKGVNIIELAAPKTFGGQRWSFSFIPLTVDESGKVSEVKGVQFGEFE